MYFLNLGVKGLIDLGFLSVCQVHEDECFLCGDGGELMMCDQKGCAKCYHETCLSLDAKPRGKWMCPWHFCDECGKRAVLLCSECPNSYCKKDAEGQITLVGENTYICNDHVLMQDDTPAAPGDEVELEQSQDKNSVSSTTETELGDSLK